MISELSCQSFLRLGYFIDYSRQRRPISFDRIDTSAYVGIPEEELLRIGAGKLQESIALSFTAGRDNVVPLSGGLDSRLVLGALLEHVHAADIRTFTFGIPGSYDFELGARVARTVGTRHANVSFEKHHYSRPDLIETARRTDFQTTLFHHPPLRQLDERYGGATVWSGYVGDAVAGSHLHSPSSASLELAKRIHLINRTFVRSMRLHTLADDAFLRHMGGGEQDPSQLSWDEQVLFAEAVPKFTAPLVLYDGFEYETPLINTPWMDFMFSVPRAHRLGERLMISVARRSYPKLFALPCKNRIGHSLDAPAHLVRGTFWLNRVRKLAHQFLPWITWPNHQYDDFDEGIRNNPSLRTVVRASVADLRARGIVDWIDIDAIWRRHDRRLRNHGDALIALASLELVLAAREQHGVTRS